jgi:hypothetical protein
MSNEPSQPTATELLAPLAKIPMPEPRVLDHAREVLWSEIAEEMLGTGAAGEQAATTTKPARGEQRHQGPTRRRQTQAPRDERRMSMGGGDS